MKDIVSKLKTISQKGPRKYPKLKLKFHKLLIFLNKCNFVFESKLSQISEYKYKNISSLSYIANVCVFR